MRRLLLALLLVSVPGRAAPAAAAPADDFHRLMDDHYRWLLRENPVAGDVARRARL